MRRKDREITDPGEIRSILGRARVMHLGLYDGEYPYVVPLHYGFTFEGGALTLYAHCAKEGRKLDLIGRGARVFVEIDTANYYFQTFGNLFKMSVIWGKGKD